MEDQEMEKQDESAKKKPEDAQVANLHQMAEGQKKA